MVDIAAKIAASQKKMKEKEEATKRQEDQEPKDTSGWVFKRVVSDPGPQSAHAFGANLTIFDAVKMGDIETIERMRSQKPSIIKETDSTGSRPIHHAARQGRCEILKYFEKIDPMLLHARNDNGMTVLHFAVQNAAKANRKDCLEVLRFILDRCDPDTVFAAADTDKSGALSYEELEVAYGHVLGPTVLKRIFKEVDVDGSGDISVVEFKHALESGALTPLTLVKDSTGSTACHVAAQRNNQIAVQFFAKYVPDILKVRDKDGRLPVHILAFNGSIETLQAITKKDSEPMEQRDFNNATLVHHAAAGGQEEMMHYLLEKMGDKMLEEVDRNGANPAHWAARSNKLNALRLIVEKKPESLAAKNRDGKVPKEMCFSDDVARFLSSHTPEIARTTSDPGPAKKAPGAAGSFGFSHWGSPKGAESAKPPSAQTAHQQEILPAVEKGAGKSLADLMKEKRTQRM